MKLKVFIDNLNDLLKDNPEAKDLEVITSNDDEGNGYTAVFFSPSLIGFDGCDRYDLEDVNEEDVKTVVLLN